MIILKNADQLAKMRSAGHLLHDVLMQVREMIAPGITTMDVNRYTDELIRKAGAIPTELGYYDYPASICASIDDEVVHGIPSENVTLMEGSILSVDVTLALDGWQADSAFTVPVGRISEEKQKLIRVTEECFWKGAAAAVNGNRIGDIGFAAAPYEMFDTNGKEIRKGSPCKMTFVCSLTNGYMGYVPSALAYPHGAYEVDISKFAPGSGEEFAQELVRMLKACKDKE